MQKINKGIHPYHNKFAFQYRLNLLGQNVMINSEHIAKLIQMTTIKVVLTSCNLAKSTWKATMLTFWATTMKMPYFCVMHK